MTATSPIQESLGSDPWQAFSKWYGLAEKLDVPNPNWMVLSTNSTQAPNSRVVLLKDYSPQNGFVFYTNYHSDKSKDLLKNNHAGLLFFWDQLNYQVRVKAQVNQISSQFSDDYFKSRPRISQIGAWASQQSQILQKREELENRFKDFEQKFSNTEVPRPEHWGGWSAKPYYFEFWQGHDGRLHERLVFSLQNKKWHSFLLYP